MTRVFSCLLPLLMVACSGLPQDSGFERHANSRLVEGANGTLIFEARASAEFPADAAAAETARMSWLAEWVAARRLCSDGYEVDNRTVSDDPADRYGYGIRYEVRCR